ncbi:hypothetical protein [Corynebacterium frankenforstense]
MDTPRTASSPSFTPAGSAGSTASAAAVAPATATGTTGAVAGPGAAPERAERFRRMALTVALVGLVVILIGLAFLLADWIFTLPRPWSQFAAPLIVLGVVAAAASSLPLSRRS